MKKDIILLAKSSKRSPRTDALHKKGYCVAGIDAETGEWIRLVSEWGTKKDESLINDDLTDKDGRIAGPLDLIRVEVLEHVPVGCQVENWLIDDHKRIKILRHVALDEVLCKHAIESPEKVYINSAPYLTFGEVRTLDHSLIIIPAKDICVYQIDYHRYKVRFEYNDTKYDNYSMTDPKYYQGDDINNDNYYISSAVLVVSLPHSPFDIDGRYYKFIASIFEITDAEYNALVPQQPINCYDVVDYARNLYNAYNDEFDQLKVKRTTWNMYYLVIQEIDEDGMICGDLYWNDGRYYQTYWRADSQDYQLYQDV